MNNIQIFSKVLGSINNFKKYILDNIIETLNKKFFSNEKIIEQDIRDIVLNNIRNQPEYYSLKSGALRNQFGIANTSLVDSVLQQLDDLQIITIRPQKKSNTIEASFIINMIKENFSEIISSSGASYTTEKGSKIDWLRWLLLEGQNSVIIGYKYIPKADPNSRTGRGIMISGESAIYRVPPQFAGTIDDNWITRGVDASVPEIESYMNRMIEKSL